jgi:alcohol dehydrogenase
LRENLDGRELNLILECIGGRIFQQGFDALAPMGRIVVYGAAQYASPGVRPNYLKMAWLYLRRPRLDVQNMTNLNKSVMAFNLIHLYEKADLLRRILAEIDALQLAPPKVGHVFPFTDLIAAIRLFQTGKTVGKVVVKVDQ